MSSTRNIVKVFLGSPGDLGDERKSAKAVVDEFNATWAEQLGYQVQLVGWEDTVTVWGRPQEIINRDLEQCELFVGLMWKKWGTPPSVGGPYSSGFEEEFRLSVERRTNTGKPEIGIFFKSVPPDLLLDPGEELKKVTKFKDELIQGKQVLFQNFSDMPEFEQVFRKCIATYVQRLVNTDREIVEDANASSAVSQEPEPRVRKGTEGSEQGPEEDDFLKRLAARDETQEMMPSEAARLRTIAHGHSTSSNDQDALGPHDANLMFGIRNLVDLSRREIFVLFEAGLARLDQQNAPLWHWLCALGGDPADHLALESMAGRTDVVKAGALRAMALLGYDMKGYVGLSRSNIVDNWLEEKEASPVKKAALDYLVLKGSTDDRSAIEKEWARGDHSTLKPAGEALISIALREGKSQAVEALIELQTETFESALLGKLVVALQSATDEQLGRVLGHRSAVIRLEALKIAARRPSTSASLLEKLTKDQSADTRYAAMLALEERGRVFSLDEAKKIIVKPQTNAFTWSFLGSSDSQSDAIFDEYKLMFYRRMDVDALLDAYDSDGPLDPWAYIALASHYKGAKPFDIREDLKDQFKSRSESMLSSFEEKYGESASNLVTRTRGFSEHTRKKFYRLALNLVCAWADPADLHLVRDCVDSRFSDADVAEITYLHRFGDWSDITRVAESADRVSGGTGLLRTPKRRQVLSQAANTVIKLAGNRVDSLVALSLPGEVLEHVLSSLPQAKVQKIEDNTFGKLFLHPRDGVRRVAAIRAVQALRKQRTIELLKAYEARVGQRYYNVAFWLDLGGCPLAEKVRKATAASALERFS